MMAAELADRVRAFVCGEMGIRPAELTPDTRIVHDLGCDGDDAAELLERFSEEFEVDLSGLQWNRYFNDEASPGCVAAIVAIIRCFRGRPGTGDQTERQSNTGLPLEPVTIRDLIAAAESRRWLK